MSNTKQEMLQEIDLHKRPGFLQKLFHNKLATIGAVVVVLVLLMALLAPVLATHDPVAINPMDAFKTPGQDGHLLGTDNFGRDLYSRIVYGARVSIIVSFGSIAVAAVIGTILGLIAGFIGGIVDTLIMRFMDGISAFPFILLAILLMAVMGQGLFNVIIAIAVGNIPNFARLIRGQVLAVKQEEFIEVQYSLGANRSRIMWHHILPNCMAPLVVQSTMSMAGAIISEASLSFLGLGIQPPTPSWGGILKDGKDFLFMNSEIATFSGLAILITVLAINLVGDGVRDALDPKVDE